MLAGSARAERLQRLPAILDQVVDVLESEREADQRAGPARLRTHRGEVVGNDEADRSGPRVADAKELQRVDEGVDLPL